TIHGLQAGPLFLSQQPDLCYLMFACVLISAIITFVLEVVFKKWLPLILKVPYHFLYSVILTISFIGAFGVSNSEFNFIIMLGWCVLAVFLMMEGVSLSPLVLAFILSDDLETYFRRGVSYAHGSYVPFITRPVSLLFLLLAVFSVVWPYISEYRKKKKAAAVGVSAPQKSDTEVHDD
ncbi:MAG: tripartite tricarboxylate transporter permease, partial [Lachnospiraceae bacterium]|nr:tripartite tricarboxylate transporter permease [Lachnospiraceae bacterium]